MGKPDRRQKSSEKEAKGQEAISKRVKPNKKESELVKEVSDEVNLQDELVSQVIFKDLFSFYGKPLDLVLDSFVALADKQPQKLKSIVDEILTNPNTSEESVTRTLFLYFFELMGLEKSDSLLYMCSFIANNSSEKKIQEMIDQEELDISFDKMVFFNQDKKSVVQKKLLKKFCKIFVADVVDGLPQKENYLTSIVEKVCILQKNSKRLVRFAFTYIGLYLYKFILSQTHELKEVEVQLQKKAQNERKLKLESQKSAKQVETIS